MILKSDIARNACMLRGKFAKQGYDWWWHSFTGKNRITGQEKAFFIDFFVCNPALGGDKPVLGQSAENMLSGRKPSYLMVKAGCWGENAKQLHRFFGWNDVSLHWNAPFEVSSDDCFCSEKALRGSVCVSQEDAEKPEYMCSAGSMSWDLKVDKRLSFNVGYVNVNPWKRRGDSLDFSMLDSLPAVYETQFVRHVRLDHDIQIVIDGLENRALVNLNSSL